MDTCPDQSVASDFPRSHEIKDESGVISKGWCVLGALSSGFIKWYHWTWWWLLWTWCWTYISGVNLFSWCSVDVIPFSQAESFQHSMLRWCGTSHDLEWVCVVLVLLFSWEVYLVGSRSATCRHTYMWWWSTTRGSTIFFSKYGRLNCVDLLATYRLIYLRSSFSCGQRREMVLTGCSTLSHNKLCGNSVIDGVLESSLSVTIDYNLLCIRVCAFYKSSLDIVCRHHEDTMVVRVEGSRNLLSREDLQWVSRVGCLRCVGRWVILLLTGIIPYFHRRGECCIFGVS